MHLFTAAARHRHAQLRGAPADPAVDDATAWLTRHDVVSPTRMIAMLTPRSPPKRTD